MDEVATILIVSGERSTIGVVERIEKNGFGIIREEDTDLPGFFSNNTVMSSSMAHIASGKRVRVTVRDNGEMLIVTTMAPV